MTSFMEFMYKQAEDHQTGCSHYSWHPNNNCINLFLKKEKKSMSGSLWIQWWNALTMCSGQIILEALLLDGHMKSWFYSAYTTQLKKNLHLWQCSIYLLFFSCLFQGKGYKFMICHMLNTINDLILIFFVILFC